MKLNSRHCHFASKAVGTTSIENKVALSHTLMRDLMSVIYLKRVGKPVIDFLTAISELISLALTATNSAEVGLLFHTVEISQ